MAKRSFGVRRLRRRYRARETLDRFGGDESEAGLTAFIGRSFRALNSGVGAALATALSKKAFAVTAVLIAAPRQEDCLF